MERSLLFHTLIGLAAGLGVGLFFGEGARVFETAADAFVRLLQMAVLPYVTVSIVASIGTMRGDVLRTLGGRTAIVLLALWALALVFALLIPLTFPPVESASFFSTTLLEPRAGFEFVDQYVPANVFHALANNVVPAVVLFSILAGVALMGLPRKQVLLDVLEAAGGTLMRVTRFVARLTPCGVFAIAATTAGTIEIEQASRLQLYLVAYTAFGMLMSLWALPGLVGALTPIPAGRIVRATRQALVTAVVAGDLFIVLPVLIEACKDLVTRCVGDAHHARTLPDLIVPVSFNLPHGGKLLSVSFVLFAGWFADVAIAPADYPRLILTAVVSLFGSITAAMPFLLDEFRIPADTFQLFVASGVVNARVGTLVAAMHTVAIALLGSCAAVGAIRWRPVALIRYVTITVALTATALGGARLFAERTMAGRERPTDALAMMTVHPRGEAIVHHTSMPFAELPRSGERLDAIAARGSVRVGYLSDALPFAFFNAAGELVGLDVALAHRLSIELDARVEFVPVGREALDRPGGAAALLQQGYCDVLIGGMAVTTTRAGLMQLSTPYLEETMGLVVPDGARRRFETWAAIREAGPITIAVPDVPYYVDKLRARLPAARLRTVPTIEALFDPQAVHADALALPAERGSAWTLRYPQYSAVVPGPGRIRLPLAWGLPRGEPELAGFVNTWLELKRRDGTLDELYEYWILGRSGPDAGPRWSIIRDVLHWVE